MNIIDIYGHQRKYFKGMAHIMTRVVPVSIIVTVNIVAGMVPLFQIQPPKPSCRQMIVSTMKALKLQLYFSCLLTSLSIMWIYIKCACVVCVCWGGGYVCRVL